MNGRTLTLGIVAGLAVAGLARNRSASLNLRGGRNAEALRNNLLPAALRDTHDLVVTEIQKRTSHWEPTGVGNGVTSVPYTYHTLVATLYPKGERQKESRLGQVAATSERKRETPIPLRGRCADDLVRLGGPAYAFGVTGAFVDEGLRGKGVGQALYAALVEAAGTHGGALTSNRCLTGTELTSADALRVWERLGRRYAVEGEVAWHRKGSAARGSRARHSLPSHLRFLEDYLGARHKGLRAYFPETAKGTLKPRKGESWYAAEGIQYLGDDDGTMVPIDAEHLEPMPENIFYPDKFSALVEAVEAGENPGVHPGYADLDVEDGALTAQVRDGNHRTFAAIAAGGTMSWVMMSDRNRQEINQREPGSESLYRAIRAAQKAAGVPLFTREAASKAKGPKKELDRLATMQARRLALQAVEEDYYRAMLRKWGRVEQTGYPLSEQLQRPQLFWRMRLGELKEAHGSDWVVDQIFDAPDHTAKDAASKERAAQLSDLLALRTKLGLKYNERLDPVTRKPVEDR